MFTIFKEIKSISATPRDLIKFSHTVSIGLLLISILLIITNQPFALPLIIAALVISLLGTATPRTLFLLYKPWMSLALIIGHISTFLILTVTFFIIITPLGIILRALGKLTFQKHADTSAHTYWHMRTNDEASNNNLNRQF
jgi:hypothetical protein